MTDRVLFVDDDRALLNTLQRNLEFSFPISLAESGAEALQLMSEGDGFAVVMADMRMPEMDGIELIQEARKIAPDTVYLMLTGNQDLASATRAVNEGHVYRFLNKPCDMSELKIAIDSASQHYQLVRSEKELLHKTFVGSIGVLTEIIDLMQTNQSNIADSSSISTTVKVLSDAMSLGESWERQLAGKLSLVGLALMPEEKLKILRRSPTHAQEHLDVFRETAAIAARMIDRIPRLGSVAEILRLQTEGDGRIATGEQSLQASATLLRVAFYWTLLRTNGLPPKSAVSEIQFVLPEIPSRVIDALLSEQPGTMDETVIRVAAEDLSEGMVLLEDVVAESGSVMISAGKRLTKPMVEKLQQYSGQVGKSLAFSIAAASCFCMVPASRR